MVQTVAVGTRRLPLVRQVDPPPGVLGTMRESSATESTAALRNKLSEDGYVLLS